MEVLKNTLKENIEYYRVQEQQALAVLTGLPRGSIKTRATKGKIYYYLQYREGSKVVQRYLGAQYPSELAAQIEKRKKIGAKLRQIRGALKLLRQKKNEEILDPVHELIELLSANGLWEEGAEIVGSWCFRIFQQYLGVRSYPVRTDDLDILIPLPWKGNDIDIANLFKQMGFQERINRDGSTAYLRPGICVEFLSPQRGRNDQSNKRPTVLGVRPQPLRFMDMLLNNPIKIKIMAGVEVTVPAPAAFMFHKFLISQRRIQKEKKTKDLAQAVSVARFALTDKKQRADMVRCWNDLLPAWRKRVLNTIKTGRSEMPLDEGILDGLENFLLSV
jgi:hypothetical protein